MKVHVYVGVELKIYKKISNRGHMSGAPVMDLPLIYLGFNYKLSVQFVTGRKCGS